MARPNLSPSFPGPAASHELLHPPQPPFSRDHHSKSAFHRSSRRSPTLPSSLLNPTSYEHLSALRSTHEASRESMFEPICNGPDGCAFLTEECEECAQVCEDGSCTVELTSQCTDQCIVVACNDAHHDASACEEFAGNVKCPGEFDCNVLDQFLQCCMDHQIDHHPDYRAFAAPAVGDYAFMSDPALDSYLVGCSQTHIQQHSRETLTFPQLDSATSTPPLLPSPAFEPSPSPFNHQQMGNPMPSPSPSALPSPSLQSHAASVFQCKWSGCFASFNTLSDLVGHVNLQHLRLPNPSASFPGEDTSFSTPSGQQVYQQHDAADGTLACLWGDCQVYPSSQSIPGPSSGDPFNVLNILTSHLLQDHLGLSARSPTLHQHLHGPFVQQTTPQTLTPTPTPSSSSSPLSADAVPDGSPPTPVPEHDCSSSSSHVCRWTGCEQSFASCDALTEHIASAHIGSGRAHYDCFWEGCSRNGDNGFASKQKISRHMQSHTGHRPFQCDVCNQNFSEAATLAQHMRRHTQEKPYVCDFPGCGKAFAIAGALTIHKRIHNGSKPFKCTYCDRAFSESSNLSKHLRTHTGARPYPCTEPGCNKSFARPDQLARHANVHKRNAAKKAPTVAIVTIW